MSYIKSIYKTIPSVWSEIFKDSPILDSIFESALGQISDSYREILRNLLSSHIGHNDFYVKKQVVPLSIRSIDIVDIDDTQTGIYSQYIQIESNIASAQGISHFADHSTAEDYLDASVFSLITDSSEISSIRSKVNNCPSLFKTGKVLATYNSPIYFKVQSNQSKGSEDLARYITLRGGLIDNQSIINLRNGSTASVAIDIQALSIDESISSLSIVKDNIVEQSSGDVAILLDPINRFTSGCKVKVRIGGQEYYGDCTTVATPITYYTLFGLNCLEENYDLFNKFALPAISGTAITSDLTMRNLLYCFYRINIEGPTKLNIQRLAASIYKVPLVEFGTINGESFLSFDFKLRKLVSNYYTYSLPISCYPSLNIISSCRLVGTSHQSDLAYLIDTSNSKRVISAISSIYSKVGFDNDLKKKDLFIKLDSNPQVFGLLGIGLDYIVLYRPLEPIPANNLLVSNIMTIDSGIVRSISTDNTVRLVYDLEVQTIGYKEAVSDVINCLESGSNYSINQDARLVLPSNLYNTSLVRRTVSSQQYEGRVGRLPVHLVGDYKIFISENLVSFKPSSYYLFDDFYKNNTYIILRPSHIADSSVLLELDKALTLTSPVWAVPLLTSTTSITEDVTYTSGIMDILKASIKVLLTDNSRIKAEESRLISDNTLFRYMAVTLAETLEPTGTLVILFTNSYEAQSTVFEASEDGLSYGIMLPSELDYSTLGAPVSVNGAVVQTYCITGVVGHSTDPLNLHGSAVVGSDLPYTSKLDLSDRVSNSEFVILSRGPKITKA